MKRIAFGLLLVLWCLVVEGGEVRTLVGTGASGYGGDGGKVENATIGGPFGLVIGPDGALYLCEIDNHCVRRIDLKAGTISTVAGTGKPGYAGDGGAATAALCREPYEVRFDRHGDMYFVEMQNHLVRKVDRKTGVISTVAGTGMPGFSGDGGPATNAQLKQPHSIIVTAGEKMREDKLYIADIQNHRVRVVDLKTGIIETLCGTGEKLKTPDGARLKGTPVNGPRALDAVSGDELFLALREGNAVYRIDLRRGVMQHLAGTGKSGYAGDGGPAATALLSGPKGLALGPGGDIYLADTESHTIRVIRKATGAIETLVGDGKEGDGPDGDPLQCRLNRPHGVFVDGGGKVYIGDSSNHRVRVYCP